MVSQSDSNSPETVFCDLTGKSLSERLAANPAFQEALRKHAGGGIFTFPLSKETIEVRVIPRGEKLLVVLVPPASHPAFSSLVAQDGEDIFYRIRLSPERFFEYVSPSVTALTGYTPEEHYLNPDLGFHIVHPEDRSLLGAILQGKAWGKPVTLRMVRKDGSILHVEQVNIPVYDALGELVAIEGIARDVSEQEHLAHAVEAKSREFEGLLENMINAFVVHEGIFDETGRFVDFRILYVNRAYERVVGVQREAILGKTARELWPGMEEEWFRYHAAVATTGVPQTFELYHTPTGRYYRCHAYRPAGETKRYCVVFDDVTALREAAEREAYLKRLLFAIRNVNQLITQEENPHHLARRACEKLTEAMGVMGAWIVFLEEEKGWIACGEGIPGLRQEIECGFLPPCVERVLREEILCIGEVASECPPCPLTEVYPQHSAVVLPLSFEGETYGVLGVSIPQTFRNDPEVQDLLREISQDLGFAFYKIKMRKALQVVEERYRLLTENIPGVVYLCYPEVPWVMLYLNERIQDLTGYPREEFLAGRITYASLCHPEDLPEMERAIAEALRTRTTFHLRYRLRHRNGMYLWVEEWGTGIFEGEKAVYLEGFIQDVTERKLAEERIQYLATHDQLTGFYNRIFLRDFLREPPLPFPLGLLLYDVNGLRLVNEAFGEKTGDQLLQHFAEVLRLSCPPEAYLFRFGGDEFLALLPSASEETLQRTASSLREQGKNANAPFAPLSFSLGFTLWEDPREPFEVALSRAEKWLHRRKLTETRSTHSAIISLLERSLHETTQETEEHAHRVVELSRRLGEALNLREEELEELELLARLHDLGKIAVPRAILEKSAPLTPEEWEVIKTHPEVGFRIAQASPELIPIAPAILSHHEHYDGTGYPRGLRGQEIPLLSRIVSVVDAYDVMRSGRPYKPPMTKEEALRELQRFRGLQFDPLVVDAFLRLLKDGNL